MFLKILSYHCQAEYLRGAAGKNSFHLYLSHGAVLTQLCRLRMGIPKIKQSYDLV